MALLEGRDLEQLQSEHPAGLPAAEAFDIAIQVADGLEAIHEAGIIHRDLKAANIMRDPDGLVRLMDFGIAKDTQPLGGGGLTGTGMILGTPEYMSPEQCRSEKLGFSSDVYSLGVVIFELFTGTVPFQGDTPMATLFKHIQEPFVVEGPLAAKLPESLILILKRALDKDPGARFETAGGVAEALRQARVAVDLSNESVSRPGAQPAAESAGRPQRETRSREAPDASRPLAPTERRAEPRLETPIDIVLRRIDDSGEVLQEERTIVDNISRRGARVMTSMSQVEVGELFEIEELGGDLKLRATARNAHTGGDRIPRLGLRVEGVHAPDRLVQTDGAREVTRKMRAVKPPAPPPRVAPAAPAPGDRVQLENPEPERRTSTRIETPLDVWLKCLGPGDGVTREERTIAENISHGGARVLTAMAELGAGDTVLFEEIGGDFKARASIRHAFTREDRIRRLNLQFLDASSPDRLAQSDDVRVAARASRRSRRPRR